MIEGIQNKILEGKYEFSQHALDQMIKRRILTREIRESISQGEIIEDYPDDKYGASCLIFGLTLNHRALHLLCSYPTRPLIKVITVYEPDLQDWLDYRYRR
ncbi:MAG: DUF4258 domain-containing protein [Limnothrix sp.]